MITDVVMPGMSGKELAQRMGQVRPGLRVLYTSGYTDETILHHGVLDPQTPFLQKPFNAIDLAAKIREVLGSPDASATFDTARGDD
jgi:FixJ family two-component response regulator